MIARLSSPVDPILAEAGTDPNPSPLYVEEQTTPSTSASGLEHSLRILARWLVFAARKGSPVADSSPVEGPQNRLDVGPAAKVGSDGR